MVAASARPMAMKFHVVLEVQPEGGFTATCVEVPGAISEGDTEAEALANVSDAIREVLRYRMKDAAATVREHDATLQTVDVDVEAAS